MAGEAIEVTATVPASAPVVMPPILLLLPPSPPLLLVLEAERLGQRARLQR